MDLSRLTGAQAGLISSERASTANSSLSNSLVNVSVKFTHNADSLTIRNKQFQIQYPTPATRSQLASAFAYMLPLMNEKTANTAKNQTISSQLVALDKPSLQPISDSISKLLKINGISQQQLFKLVSQYGEYSLGEGKLTGKHLIFNQETAIVLSKHISREGSYRAGIIIDNGKLHLQLSPIIAKANVNLVQIASTNTSPESLTTTQAKTIVETRLETSSLYRQTAAALGKAESNSTALSATELATIANKANQLAVSISRSIALTQPDKLIEAIKIKAALNSTGVTPHSQENNVQKLLSPTSPTLNSPETEQLNKLTSKLSSQLSSEVQLKQAASIPEQNKVQINSNEQSTSEKSVIKNTLLQQLLAKLPNFLPNTLDEIAVPSRLKRELHSTSQLNLSNMAQTQTALTNAGALSTIFQLLLGLKANSSGEQVSKHLLQQIQKLQRTHDLSPALLGKLARVGLLENTAQIASSLQLYQQASGSSEQQQGVNWYFALPYQLDNKHEQFEGHFESGESTEDKSIKDWRLQLKFNLSQGSMLVMAHKRSETLALTFKTESDTVLQKINQHISPLSQKLSALGFEIDEIKTQYEIVPATLLPGDYYLVQTRA